MPKFKRKMTYKKKPHLFRYNSKEENIKLRYYLTYYP